MRRYDQDIAEAASGRHARSRQAVTARHPASGIGVPVITPAAAGVLSAAVVHLQRTAGNAAVVARLFSSKRRPDPIAERDLTSIQRDVQYKGFFNPEFKVAEGAAKFLEGMEVVHQKGLEQFKEIDQPVTLREAPKLNFNPHEMDALNQGVIGKIDAIKNVTLILVGQYGRTPSGDTELWLKNAAGGEPVNLTSDTDETFQTEIAKVPDPLFEIRVVVKTSQSSTTPGRVVQILNHELSAHAEPFADFITAHASSVKGGKWETEGEQHDKLHKGGFPRYKLLGDRYVNAGWDTGGYQAREQQDQARPASS